MRIKAAEGTRNLSLLHDYRQTDATPLHDQSNLRSLADPIGLFQLHQQHNTEQTQQFRTVDCAFTQNAQKIGRPGNPQIFRSALDPVYGDNVETGSSGDGKCRLPAIDPVAGRKRVDPCPAIA